MQKHIPVIMAGLLYACSAPARSENELNALRSEVEMREVRVAQVTPSPKPKQQQKKVEEKQTPPEVKFAPPQPRSTGAVEQDKKKQPPVVKFDPPRQKAKPVKKVKIVNEATGEAKLYDENNKEITEKVSPRTKKVKIVKDPSGHSKVLDENGKVVTEVPALPPPPPPVEFKKPVPKKQS